MSYALLWVEAVLTALLWAAMVMACAAHFRSRWISRWLVFLMLIVPTAIFGALLIAAAILKFHFQVRQNWFGYALSLLLTYLIGAIDLVRRARRRTALAPEPSAATWPRGRLALALLTAAVVATMTLWNMDLEVRSQTASLRNEAGAMFLSVSPPAVNDSLNAGIVYEKAFARLAADKALHDRGSPLDDDVSDENNAAIAEIMKRHELTIALLRKAAAMPQGRFEHDYVHPSINMLLPELNRVRHAARFLCLHARYEQAHGQVASAIQDVNAIFQMGKTGEVPILVPALVSIGVDALAIKALQDVLPAVTKQDELAGLDVGDAEFFSRLMQRSLRGEEAFGLSIFSDMAANRLNIGETLGMVKEAGTATGLPLMDVPPAPMLMRVFLMADDVASYRELFDRYEREASQPYYEKRSGADADLLIRHSGLVTSMIAPAMTKALTMAARARAMHADAQMAVAMTRYRLDHGNFPASLDLLAPAYLDEIAPDPFDGKPLRLIHKNNEWIIYSIGEDGKDDGGAPFEYVSQKGDLPFVLKAAK